MRQIKFTYNPYNSKISICNNEKEVNMNDIYNNFYAVSKYPFSCWVGKCGAWPGILQQLRDLTRGEEFSLLFEGRECDYLDLKQQADKEAEGKFRIEIEWVPEYELDLYERILTDIKKRTMAIWNGEYKGYYPYQKDCIHNIEKRQEQINQLKVREITVVNDINSMPFNLEFRNTSIPYIIESSGLRDMREIKWFEKYVNCMERSGDSVLILKNGEMSEYLERCIQRHAVHVVKEDDIGEIDAVKAVLKNKYLFPVYVRDLHECLESIVENFRELLRHKENEERTLSQLKESIKKDEEEDDDLEEYNILKHSIKWSTENKEKILTLSEELSKIYLTCH